MSELLLQVVKALVAAMAQMLTPQQVKILLDKAFDKVEDMVKDSETHWDDVIVLPLLAALRNALSVPDNDDD